LIKSWSLKEVIGRNHGTKARKASASVVGGALDLQTIRVLETQIPKEESRCLGK
jgi:hypothetical protein